MARTRLLAALLVLVPAAAAQAATYTVGDGADGVAAPADCVDGGAGSGSCSLRDAVAQANADAVASTIRFNGTGNNSVLASSPELSVTAPVDIEGSGANTTIITGVASARAFNYAAGLGTTFMNLRDLRLQSGTATTSQSGGGILLNSNSSLRVTGVWMTGNSAGHLGGAGGAIRGEAGSTLEVVRSALTSNHADRAGAISSAGSLTLIGTHVFGNDAFSPGTGVGGVESTGAAGTITLRNSAITGNDHGTGNAAVANNLSLESTSGMSSAINSIVNDSIGGTSCTVSGFTWASGATNNIDSTANQCAFGSGNLMQTDPMIGGVGLAPNGLPNKFLQPGSPAIEAGTNATCPALDMYGVSRPQDANGDGVAKCDIGPYEVAGIPCTTLCPPPVTGDPAPAGGGDSAAPPAGGGSSPPARDTTAPGATLSGKASSDGKSVNIDVTSTEDGTASATGTFSLGATSKTFRLNSAKATVKAGKKTTLSLKIGSKAQKALKRARKAATASIAVSVADLAGNRTAKTQKLKLKKKKR